ncbi:MAG: methionine--tRNA ligase [Deltaproteobacteria bacterium]|nr:methionine--tRNA ligase [Deltaproteobacteria bacterium]
MRAFYITTPIYYVNDVPHLGHAYTTVAADALARYHRARGHATWFLTGTDEHGQNIEDVARARGKTPKQHADEVVVRFMDTWKRLDVSNDDFIRTTDERHIKVVHETWKRMEAAGDIYLGSYEGLYCKRCEAFYTEGQLEEGRRCPVHQAEATVVKEPSYFFRMSKYQDRLLEYYEKNPQVVLPEMRRNEIVSFIRSGLRDLSISRTSFKWGIPVPGDEKHVIYVWVDALTNYISALGGEGSEKYKTFWPSAVHLIGKDILRFHAVYWPAMLMSCGLPLPKHVLAHGWWTVRGQKISKSLPATRVDPNRLAEDIGPDSLRYFLLREVPLGLDGDFSYEALIGRHNSDLANDLGNLLHRTLAMTEKYVGGVVPRVTPALDETEPHKTIAGLAIRARDEAERHFEALAPSRALEAIWEFIRGANRYVDAAAPWTLAKDPARRSELDHVVHTFLEAGLWAAWLAAPVIPRKAREILGQLGLADAPIRWPTAWNQELSPGSRIQRGAPLFPRIDEAKQAELLSRWIPPEAQAAPPSVGAAALSQPESVAGSGTITYEEFARLDLRTAVVKHAEHIPKADKLLKLQLDMGGETRQVVAGIAEAYKPEDLLGRQVIFLANLKPAVIRGIESQGMILAAGDKQVLALSALDRDVPAGTKVR